jgi:hypothetical protein
VRAPSSNRVIRSDPSAFTAYPADSGGAMNSLSGRRPTVRRRSQANSVIPGDEARYLSQAQLYVPTRQMLAVAQ